jgi:hypothetical protein
MRVTGEDIFGEPADPEAARDVLRRAADTVYFVDTTSSTLGAVLTRRNYL